MANWVQDFFNSTFGSNETYVSNAYSNTPYVYVYFTKEKLTLSELKLLVSNKSANAETSISIQKITSMVKIPQGDYHKYRRTSGIEYMTVMPVKNDGSFESYICENYQISPNRSFIITKNGGIKPQKYGSNNLWEDESGFDHRK